MKNVLVIGGAGYIGSHMVKYLARSGINPITLDNLSTGYREAVRYGIYIYGSAGDSDLLDKIFTEYRIEAVIHFASFSQVGESVREPSKYYSNNVSNTLDLLKAMVKHRVKRFIFSSSAAVYGIPAQTPIDESQPKSPINPYGLSKWIVEQTLHDYESAYGLRSICLRYFNAAGADPEGELGECHNPETHLIPLVLQTALGVNNSLTVNGCNYPTRDGTCIRDYIHVEDLCSAHMLALEALMNGESSKVYNLGNGQGFSVNQVISTTERVLKRPVSFKVGPRRPGDPPVLVANAEKISRELGWTPYWTNLEDIILHASNWELRKIASRGDSPFYDMSDCSVMYA